MRPGRDRIRLTALLVGLGAAFWGPVCWSVEAQAQTVDYAAVFAEHEQEIVPGGEIDGRAVDLLAVPPGIELRRLTGPNGEVTYTGIDATGDGAVGCLFDLYFELVAMGRSCPWTPPKAEAAMLETRLRRITRFVLANGVPERDPADAEDWLEARLARWQEDIAPRACGAPDAGLQGFAGALASEAFAPVLDKALAVPRLPVSQPCL